jgi:hypothetical protein
MLFAKLNVIVDAKFIIKILFMQNYKYLNRSFLFHKTFSEACA